VGGQDGWTVRHERSSERDPGQQEARPSSKGRASCDDYTASSDNRTGTPLLSGVYWRLAFLTIFCSIWPSRSTHVLVAHPEHHGAVTAPEPVRHEISVPDRVEARDGRAALVVPLIFGLQPIIAVDAPQVNGVHRIEVRHCNNLVVIGSGVDVASIRL
jgi:hypothetical protein